MAVRVTFNERTKSSCRDHYSQHVGEKINKLQQFFRKEKLSILQDLKRLTLDYIFGFQKLLYRKKIKKIINNHFRLATFFVSINNDILKSEENIRH
jgi:hypothetical protein